MLTGDNPTTAQIVADAVGGLDEVHRSNDFVDEPAYILLLKPV
jgi:magnesium-transporting ATPase (P-type)